ncbi:hypothetical protein RclHR1_20990004 [Rhizophagus clarus]|uniref:Uncharacterized protein n=1 Tax=Rhizophagus clarus TaxID=94130 RepID=A0A2Z6QSH8_9GLOM|nr:hypothetical protein RclHR1_20990004 [Rhizophagus clarus]
MPVFAGNDDNDLERFFELYKGYLHGIGIDPSAVADNPAGWEKAMGILHACLTGPAARWYDSNILGKRVKLRNILLRLAHGDEVAFKALLGNNVNCPANTWANGAVALMVNGAGNSINNPVTNIWPNYAIEGNRDIWLNRTGMEFTNDPLNYNIVGGAAGLGVAIAGGAGVGQPYVIPAYPCHVLIKMRNEFPTQQNARRQLRSAELLGYGNDVLVNQFLRGLNNDCAIEAERIGAERDIEELVGLLERIEKRKAELRLGKERQENIQYQRDRQIIPEQLPPVSQEPDSYPDEGPNPFDDDRDDDRHLQQLFDYASGGPAPRNTLEQRLANKIAKRIAKAKERREDAELNRAMRELFLNDYDDPMDTFNAIRGVPIELVQELINLLKLADIRKIIQEIVYKILENYESAPQEQSEVQEEYLDPMAMDIDVAQLENSKDLLAINGNVNGIDRTQKYIYRGRVYQCITIIVELDRVKFLGFDSSLADNFEDIQCLADSCANVSWIQEEAVPELKLKANKSIKHSIAGASGLSETLGIVKNVSIELLPGCIIKEDLVVLKGYKHREIGLSRTCLKRYNYDIHESRKYIALTCNNIVPIIPDANRT